MVSRLQNIIFLLGIAFCFVDSKNGLFSLQNNRSQITYDPLSEQQRYEIRSQVARYLDGSLDEIDVSTFIVQALEQQLNIICNQFIILNKVYSSNTWAVESPP